MPSKNPTAEPHTSLARRGVLRRKEVLLPLPGPDSVLLGCHGIWGRLETGWGNQSSVGLKSPFIMGGRDGSGLPLASCGISLELMGEAAHGAGL